MYPYYRNPYDQRFFAWPLAAGGLGFLGGLIGGGLIGSALAARPFYGYPGMGYPGCGPGFGPGFGGYPFY